MWSAVFFVVTLSVISPAWSLGEPVGTPPLPATLAEVAPCVASAAKYHHVNPWVLKAILKVESNFNPNASNRNANGTVDVGMAQINSMHFSRLRQYGITPEHLMDGCISTYVAAWHLAAKLRKYGNTWFGIAAYHSTTPCQNERYRGLIWNALVDWKVVAGMKVAVRPLAQCGYVAPSVAGANRVANSPALSFDAAN